MLVFPLKTCFHLHEPIASLKKAMTFGLASQNKCHLQCIVAPKYQTETCFFFLKHKAIVHHLQTMLNLFHDFTNMFGSAGERYLWQPVIQSWPGLPPVLIKMAESPA